MKRRGFTLIELLAVIIILAVIAMITLPLIMNVIDDAQKNSFKDSAYGMIEAAKLKSSQADTETGFKQQFYDLTDGSLHYKGEPPLEGMVSTDTSGNTSIEMHDDKWCVKKGFSDKDVMIVPYDNSSKPCDGSGIDIAEAEGVQPKVPVTERIYWALQDNDNDGKNETLVISDSEVSGNESGNFSGNRNFTLSTIPWCASSGMCNKVSNVKIEGTVAPTSTAFWLYGVGESASSFQADLTNLNVSNVTDMSFMFYRAGITANVNNLIGLENWNTSKVAKMNGTFYNAGFAADTFSLDLSKWNTSKVTELSELFNGAGGGATTLNLNLSNWYLPNVTSLSMIFNSVGYYSTNINLNLSNWRAPNVTNMHAMFYKLGCIGNIENTGNTGNNIIRNHINLIGLETWDTSSVTDMSQMFDGIGYFADTLSLDLSNWNTSKVTNMSEMFSSVGSNATAFNLNLSNWNTSNVTNISSMFSGAGDNTTTWVVTIPKTNGGSINNTTSKLYGKTSSTYVFSPSEKFFTLAN